MSDNKKYYYLKLKESYFDQDHIKIIEAHENGHTYSLIILKIYLKALKGEGRLLMNESIPYDPKNVDLLAKVIGHDPDHVSKALNLAKGLGMVTLLDMKEIWINDIQNFIGQSSTEGDRKREYRLKIQDKNTLGHWSDERPPELELETE